MTRRASVLVTIATVVVSAVLVSALPVRAARFHAISPAQIDPNTLQLPASALPPGAQVVHSAVSTNDDAQGTTTPADGDSSVFGLAHGGPASYASEGRITGYRMDIHYQVNGVDVRTGYLASNYPSAAQAQTAYSDVTGPLALIHIIGGKPLPDACQAGEKCDAEYFLSPLDTTREAISTVAIRGSIVIETASDAPATQFNAIETAWEHQIYSILAAADALAQSAQSGSESTPPADTPTTAPTVTPSPTSIPPTSTPTQTALFVRVKLGHTTVKSGIRQTITVTTLPGAHVTIKVRFPRGKGTSHSGVASKSGKLSWHFTQRGGATKGSNHTASVHVTVSLGGETHKTTKKYKIR